MKTFHHYRIALCFLFITTPLLTLHAQNNTWQIELENGLKYEGFNSFCLRDDSLLMNRNDSLSAFAINSISTIRFYRKSFLYERMLHGAEIGAGIMGLGMILEFLLNNKDDSNSYEAKRDNTSGTKFIFGLVAVMASATIGGIIGGLIGTLIDIAKSQDDVYEMANHSLKAKRNLINHIIVQYFH
ncbi:MAG: hypothetical protein NTX44_13390 [Ignavibacteriales bacterium]|nr:hypothetical protein [Ignavibacteriales bacterium]